MPRRPRRRFSRAVIAVAIAAGACSSATDGTGGCADSPPADLADVDRAWAGPGDPVDDAALWPVDPRAGTDTAWGLEVVAEVPHDRSAFTQGLEFDDSRLLESTGCRGRSEVRELDPRTGEVLRAMELPAAMFGEGLTVVGDEVIQLTWLSGIARRLRADSLEPTGEVSYTGEGWGLCAGPDGLVMSNGTPTLTVRDPSTFEVRRSVGVVRDGEPVSLLNELECVDGLVMANIYRSDEIVVIDPASGQVLADIDAAALRADIGTDKTEEVLNGIAAVGDGTLLLGGKHWPRHFIVRLTPD